MTDEPADTPTDHRQINNGNWLEKEEAARLLGRDKRQIDRRARQGFIETKREEQPWQRKARRYFSRADILAILDGKPNRYPVTSSQRSTQGNGGNDGQPGDGGRGAGGNGGNMPDGHPDSSRLLNGIPKRPWLTLSEAAVFSGLPEEWLQGQAEAGTIHAVNVGKESAAWMFSRKGLKKVGKA